jgi:hypothetical protein
MDYICPAATPAVVMVSQKAGHLSGEPILMFAGNDRIQTLTFPFAPRTHFGDNIFTSSKAIRIHPRRSAVSFFPFYQRSSVFRSVVWFLVTALCAIVSPLRFL